MVRTQRQASDLRLLGGDLRRRRRAASTTPPREALAKLRPLNAYGWSKHLVDRRIARLRERGDALPPQCVGLKFFNVYGPNEYHKGTMQSVVARNFAAVRRGEPLRLFRSDRSEYRDGGQLRDFVYVRDCVEVMLWLLDNPHVSGLFNVGSGTARSWLDLAQRAVRGRAAPGAHRIHRHASRSCIDKYQYFTEARIDATARRRLLQALHDPGSRRRATTCAITCCFHDRYR